MCAPKSRYKRHGRRGPEGTQSDSDMVPQPAKFDRFRSGGMCCSKRVHAPLSYGRMTIQQSSNVVADNGSPPQPGGDRKEARDGEPCGLATHLSQVRSVATLAVASGNAERAADVRPWAEFRDDVRICDGVRGGLGLAGGDGKVALGARLDVDCLRVSETGVLVRMQVQEVALEIGKNYSDQRYRRYTKKRLIIILTGSREKIGPSGCRLTMNELPFCTTCQSKRPKSLNHEGHRTRRRSH